MTTRAEFHAAVDELERAVTQLALVALAFRRLERDMFPDPQPQDPKPQEEELHISPPWTNR